MTSIMTEKLLQISFQYQGSGNNYQELVKLLSNFVANEPGLIWKTWLMNELEAEAGGIYLFTDAQALERYLQGSVMTGLEGRDDITNISVKIFDTLNEIPLVALKRWRDSRGAT